MIFSRNVDDNFQVSPIECSTYSTAKGPDDSMMMISNPFFLAIPSAYNFSVVLFQIPGITWL